MARNLLILLALFSSKENFAQFKFSITGVVIDNDSKTNVIPGAYVEADGCSQTSSNSGTFTMTCPSITQKSIVRLTASAVDYESSVGDYNVGNAIITIYLKRKKSKDNFKEYKIVGSVLNQDGEAISNAFITAGQGSYSRVGTDGKFILSVKTSNAAFIECNAEGYEPFRQWVSQSDKPLDVILIKETSLVKERNTKTDTTIFSDKKLIETILGESCCETYSNTYYKLVNQVRNRLIEYYTQISFVNNPSHPLQFNLEKLVLTLSGRIRQSRCEEEISTTIEILDWLHQNQNAKNNFTKFDALHLLLDQSLRNDLAQLRRHLSLLLLEGFKKAYLLESYERLPLRNKKNRRIDFKNRVKIFEFVIAVSNSESLKSNLYQAQSELIQQGKIGLPLLNLQAGWNWSEESDPEYYVTHYFPSKKDALKTICANSLIKDKTLTTESVIFKNIADQVSLLRFKIDKYIAILSVYNTSLVFDGYESYDQSMSDYYTFLGRMPCQLLNPYEECNEASAFRWK